MSNKHPHSFFASRRRAVAGLAAAGLVATAGAVVPAAEAASLPTVPDSVFPAVAENPAVTVTFEDGTPVNNHTPVHRGDVLLVHGTGFSAAANRGGFVMPIPPGVANGVYVLYSGLGDFWRPSAGAPGPTRTHPHDKLAWVLPDSSLGALPQLPVDLRTPIAREAQRMNGDGTFAARIVVDPPAQTPGQNFGVYVYPAAGSINAPEELFVPIPFDRAAGANTPPAPTADLVVDAGVLEQVAHAAGGALTPREGAQVLEGARVAYSAAPDAGDGVVRYRGTVHVTSRFSIADVAIKDPWIEPRPNGARALTAEISNTYNGSDDALHRQELGTIAPGGGGLRLMAGPIDLGAVTVAQ